MRHITGFVRLLYKTANPPYFYIVTLLFVP
jgi:hypothetical protein